MKLPVHRWLPQPLTAVIATVLALIVLVEAWRTSPGLTLDAAQAQDYLIALFLAVAVVGAGLYPIHFQHNFKVVVTTAPLYAAAILLPPLLAALVAGLSMLLFQLLTNAQRGNTPSDIATLVSRWIISAFLSAWVAQHLTQAHGPLSLVLVSVAVVMFTCDIVLGAFEIAPMMNLAHHRVMALLLREALLPEGAQYLLGVLAVLAALQQPWSLVLWPLPLWVMYRTFKYAKEMHDGTSKLLESMADAVDLRDPYTGGHSRRVTTFSQRILRELNVTGPEVDLILSAARVHDIGKIGIPDHILNKPARLTDEEKALMDSHPERGAQLLMRYQDFARGREIVRHHHERWDGAGYPSGLAGLDIPFGARVIAVADSFDAMTSDRPYRKGMTTEQAMHVLRNGCGTQWDATIVEAFLRHLEREQQAARPEAMSGLQGACTNTLAAELSQ